MTNNQSLIELIGLEQAKELVRIAEWYGSNATHAHVKSHAIFMDCLTDQKLYIYTGQASIMEATNWKREDLIGLSDLRTAIAEHHEFKVNDQVSGNDIVVLGAKAPSFYSHYITDEEHNLWLRIREARRGKSND